MNISISGSGYVGLITGAGLASLGHKVTCVDIDREKVDMINSSKPPIYEKGLQEIMEKAVPDSLKATTDLKKAVNESSVTFVCVGTPSRPHGEIKLHFIEQISKEIGKVLKGKDSYHLIVIKSTVIPGTTEKVVGIIEKVSGKRFRKDFGAAMNPEFLREGSALDDFYKPDRIVIGSPDEHSRKVLKELYSSFRSPILETSFNEAEMIKYASNAFLATKISFINELGNICKKMGIDTNLVAKGVGMDYRISPYFLRAGIGFGGSCFPKDVAALVHKATSLGITPRLLNSVLDVNKDQPLKIFEILEDISLKGKKVAVLGLTFKKDTDDIRESPSLTIIKQLLMEQAQINIYDPMGMPSVMKIFPHLNYCQSAQKAVDSSEIILILTEWDEFKDADYGKKLVLDGKNLLYENPPPNYEGVCW